MKITVLGLSRLGSVTAACASKHFRVMGVDSDEAVVADLRAGKAPVHEPGLNDLIAEQLEARRLTFTTNIILACVDAEVLWVTYDDPTMTIPGSPAGEPIVDRLHRVLPNLAPGVLVLISSQLPVGTCAALQVQYPQFRFACSPENLRHGRAIDAFENAERVVIGVRDDAKKEVLERLFDPFAAEVVFMPMAAAEMVKFAVDIYATSMNHRPEVAALGDTADGESGDRAVV
ncbi:MAG: hypothetical protein WCF18_12765 [Chthoniobacteraceae bacterium]